MNTAKDHYAVLGVLPSVDDVVITAAYRALLKRYHPDVFNGPRTEGQRRTIDIIEAYQVLSNPAKRKAYDNSRQTFLDGGFANWAENKRDIYKNLTGILVKIFSDQ
jgi:molecular chaperone DnaJ